jgi:hypothetical protein
MNGKAMRLELVEAPPSDDASLKEDPETETENRPEHKGSVISLKDFKKN